MKKMSVLLALVTLACPAVFAGSGETGFVTIKSIAAGDGLLAVAGDTDFADPSSCSGSGTSEGVIILESTDSYKEMVAIVLSAKLSKTPVQFYVDGCTTFDGTQYPKGTFAHIE